jgi:hypothetical protein
VLGVAALQICHPIELLVLVKSDYPLLQGLSLPSRAHEPRPIWARCQASPAAIL